MLTRWKNKDKDKEKFEKSGKNQQNYSSNSSKKKRKNGRDGEDNWNNEGKQNRDRDAPPAASESSHHDRCSKDEKNERMARFEAKEERRRHALGMINNSNGQEYMLSTTANNQRRDHTVYHTLNRTHHHVRNYFPPTNGNLFDDDPGIMSEVETSSTGFRRGGKQRSSLPVVRTPSKTLERPLGLVFLQYRNETKRALLPNEITSIDTVKALFVRSFCKQLTMDYMDSSDVKIYIHDPSKDMFYELEDVRSHLREIRDRSVLRLFESSDVAGGLPAAGIGIAGNPGAHCDDTSYFSEPEFDSDYQSQHVHKSKNTVTKTGYYMGSTASLPRGTTMLHNYSTSVSGGPIKTLSTGMKFTDSAATIIGNTHTPPKPQRSFRSNENPLMRSASDRFAHFQRAVANNSHYTLPTDGYVSSPERGNKYDDPYYAQYSTRSGSITPIIDEETSDTETVENSYSIYGSKIPNTGSLHRLRNSVSVSDESTSCRLRVEHMERQLANLTGLVQKALTQTPTSHLQIPVREAYRDKSVSFEKSVSFSDEPPNSPKQHSPQHGNDTKPSKPAIKCSTLPRVSSQEKDRGSVKLSTISKQTSSHLYTNDLHITPEMYNQLRGLQKKAKDLKTEIRNLRRISQAQAHFVKETITDTFLKIQTTLALSSNVFYHQSSSGGCCDPDRFGIHREEYIYKQEMLRLESDLSHLESTVEELRSSVINRKTRVNMCDVENMALVLNKSSKMVAELKMRFPALQDAMKSYLGDEMDKLMKEEQFLNDEPDRLENALRRCKKLTGTLVTLKRLASVQEQRLPCSNATGSVPEDQPNCPTSTLTTTISQHNKFNAGKQYNTMGTSTSNREFEQKPENALDALLDELETLPIHNNKISINTKPPLPEYHHHHNIGSDHVKRVPPPPPPRTSSRSPLSSPTTIITTTTATTITSSSSSNHQNLLAFKQSTMCHTTATGVSIDQIKKSLFPSTDKELKLQHLEILCRKQKALQEQYARLQQLQNHQHHHHNQTKALHETQPPEYLKKTGSESNILQKIGLQLSTSKITGSLTDLTHTIHKNNDADKPTS